MVCRKCELNEKHDKDPVTLLEIHEYDHCAYYRCRELGAKCPNCGADTLKILEVKNALSDVYPTLTADEYREMILRLPKINWNRYLMSNSTDD